MIKYRIYTVFRDKIKSRFVFDSGDRREKKHGVGKMQQMDLGTNLALLRFSRSKAK